MKVGPVHGHQVAAAGGGGGAAEGLFKGEIQPGERRGGIGEEARGAKVATAQPHPKQVLPREAGVDREAGVVVNGEGIQQGKAHGRIGALIHGAAVVAEGPHHSVHIHAHDGGGGEGLQFLGGGEGLQLLGAEGLGEQGAEQAADQAKGSQGFESRADCKSSGEMGSRWRHRCLKGRGQNTTTAPSAYPTRPMKKDRSCVATILSGGWTSPLSLVTSSLR